MSCPDWRRLERLVRPDLAAAGAPGAAADGVPGAASAAAARWQEALRHLDGGCPRCWQEAVAVDPTLIFRRLPAVELPPAQEAEEVAAARLAVAAMRTASRRPARAMQQQHLRWVVAAGLTAMALIFGAEHGWRGAGRLPAPMATSAANAANVAEAAAGTSGSATPGSLDPRSSPSSQSSQGSPGAPGTPGLAAAGSGWAVTPVSLPSRATATAAPRPSIEGLSRPEARVYQLDSPHMSVVMIVDSKLDV
jgi:hypothetical protein